MGGLGVLDTERVREDIDLAVQTTLEFGVQGWITLLRQYGRAELLLSAGQRLARPELEEAARANAWRVVSRAERTDGFVLHPMLPKQVDNPGFFQGTAGIGYELLRMARPALLPSVLLWESALSTPRPTVVRACFLRGVVRRSLRMINTCNLGRRISCTGRRC